MSYEKELTTFKKGNQLSTCGEYNLQDLSDMFSETCIGGSEDENGHEVVLEDILNEENTVLSMNVTIMEQLNNDEIDMFIKKYEDNNEVECSASLDNAMYNESI